MEVETYEVMSIDVDASGAPFSEETNLEALALIEALGLEGQKKLIDSREAGTETTERIMPYRLLTAEEKAIFSTLFSTKTPIELFKSEPIPLRVLQVAAHAKEYDLTLFVLHPSNDAYVVDPVLIGERQEPIYPGASQKHGIMYILARWGPALASIEELRDKAAPKVAAMIRSSASIGVRKFQQCVDNAEDIATLFLNGEDAAQDIPSWVSVSMPTFKAGR